MLSAPENTGSVLAHWSSLSTFGRVQICGATSLIGDFGWSIWWSQAAATVIAIGAGWMLNRHVIFAVRGSGGAARDGH